MNQISAEKINDPIRPAHGYRMMRAAISLLLRRSRRVIDTNLGVVERARARGRWKKARTKEKRERMR
ncbi:hypothetical protein ZHAS_00004444 [Anopheles sinensis]|uniref:Uncharacterized protein n=1 Tax=Anopheles sinensis TaxID=74873 RepID=A0A084VGY6_ANOSI|nr:hypothetical protein ZHAS_00004444 [Anopheles sinensis]